MNIACDLDGVITKIIVLNPSWSTNKIFNSDFSTLAKMDEVRPLAVNFLLLVSALSKVRENASNVVNKLIDERFNINIITSRYYGNEHSIEGHKIRKSTRNFLRRNNIKYHNLIFTNSNKIDACLSNNIDVIIEDNPKNIIVLSKLIKVIVMDTYYNKDIIGDNIYHASSWKDVYNIIKTLSKEKGAVEKLNN